MTGRSRFRLAAALAACLAAAFILDSCGDSSSFPTEPNPSPAPSARPVPAPTATPAPAPAPPAPSPTPLPTEPDLVIEIVAINGNMSFIPANASVQAGQLVRWHNAHLDTHTATQDGGGFDTGFIRPGATSAPITITAPGTLTYHCQIHPSMVGSVRLAR